MRWLQRFAIVGGITAACATQAPASSGGPADSAATLDELLAIPISTASRYAQLTREAPASVTLVTSEEIQGLGFRTLAEVISFVRGFYLSYDRNYSYVGVRGFSRPTDYNNRILLLLNGHPLNENVYESALLGTEFGLDLGMVDRVEVVRGPGSALYGSTAVFAVVNVITRGGEDISGVKASVEMGSHRLARGAVLGGTRTPSGVDIMASGNWFSVGGPDLYYPEYDTPEENNGMARRIDADRGFGVASVVSIGGFSLQGMATGREKVIPTAAFGVRFNDGRLTSTDRRWSLATTYRYELGPAARLSSRVSLDGYDYEGGYPYDEFQQDASTGRWYGAEANLQWDSHSFNRIDLGLSYTRTHRADYRIWSGEGTIFSKDVPFEYMSAYLQNTTQLLPNVSLSLAARADRHSRVGWMITPRLALIYNPWDGGTLKALYGEAFRAPTIYELYYEEDGVQRANPQLSHELNRAAEVAFEQRLTRELILFASLYRFAADDLIDIVVDPIDSLFQYRNISETRAQGVELELVGRFPGGVSAGASIAMQSATDETTGERLTNSPGAVVKAHCMVPFLEQFSAACRLRYEASRVTVYHTTTDPFCIADLHLTAARILGRFDLSVLIANVFNGHYANPGGNEHRQAVIVQNGRTFSVRIGVSL